MFIIREWGETWMSHFSGSLSMYSVMIVYPTTNEGRQNAGTGEEYSAIVEIWSRQPFVLSVLVSPWGSKTVIICSVSGVKLLASNISWFPPFQPELLPQHNNNRRANQLPKRKTNSYLAAVGFRESENKSCRRNVWPHSLHRCSIMARK